MNINGRALYEILIWQAEDLADRGRYEEAESILSAIESDDRQVNSLNYEVRAKIKYDQKDYLATRNLLQKAVAYDPANSSARNLLQQLSLLKKRAIISNVFIIVLIAFIFFWTLSYFFKREVKKANANEMLITTSRNEISIKDYVSFFANISGIRVDRKEKIVNIAFVNPVFSSECIITESGRVTLEEVKKVIDKLDGTFIMIIKGHTDNLPVYPGSQFYNNRNLGLLRAETVRKIFEYKSSERLTEIYITTPLDDISIMNKRTISIMLISN